jgi:hypothetical protein
MERLGRTLRVNRGFVLRAFILSFIVVGTLAFARTDGPPPSLYERVAAKLSANPALAEAIGKPSPELQAARWLAGRWNVTARVFATPGNPERVDRGQSTVEEVLGGTWLQFRDTYDGKVQDLSFLTCNPVTRRWISMTVDHTGNAVAATADGWRDGRLVFVTRNAEILGEPVVLRQTFEKRSAREYRVLNEEQLSDGSWVAVDEYLYRKE